LLFVAVCIFFLGAGQFFWSLPSKAQQVSQSRLDKLDSELVSFSDQEQQTTSELKAASACRQSTKERKLKLDQLSQLRRKRKELEVELSSYEAYDPERLKKLKTGIEITRNAANRWTDNFMLLMSYYKQRAGGDIDTAAILQHFELPKDFDNLD